MPASTELVSRIRHFLDGRIKIGLILTWTDVLLVVVWLEVACEANALTVDACAMKPSWEGVFIEAGLRTSLILLGLEEMSRVLWVEGYSRGGADETCISWVCEGCLGVLWVIWSLVLV